MKTFAATFALGLLLGANATFAATAYDALQVIKKDKGEAILKQLIEVRGESGRPQPQEWTILMNDSTARGGIREFVVSGNEILSERTPLHGYVDRTQLPSLNFTRLNLDSDGAFRLANAQASDMKVGFDSVDYTLRTNDATGAPMWVLRLFDYMGAPVGTMQVSAENGDVVSNLRLDSDARIAGAPNQEFGEQKPPAKVTTSTTTTTTSSSDHKEMGGVIGFVGRTAKNVGTTVKNTSLHVAGTVQEVLTGDRTIDQDIDENANDN